MDILLRQDNVSSKTITLSKNYSSGILSIEMAKQGAGNMDVTSISTSGSGTIERIGRVGSYFSSSVFYSVKNLKENDTISFSHATANNQTVMFY